MNNILVQNDRDVKINSPTRAIIERNFKNLSKGQKFVIYLNAIRAQFEYPEWDIFKTVIFGFEVLLQEGRDEHI